MYLNIYQDPVKPHSVHAVLNNGFAVMSESRTNERIRFFLIDQLNRFAVHLNFFMDSNRGVCRVGITNSATADAHM